MGMQRSTTSSQSDAGREVMAIRMPGAAYPSAAPYHPSTPYPELQSLFGNCFPTSDSNDVYAQVRSALELAGTEPADSSDWNPLRHWIHPGDTVLLKPNMIKESHPRDPNGWVYTITHGSLIRAVADYVWKALDGSGRVIVADAPQGDSSFSAMCELLGLVSLRDFYLSHGLNLEVFDLRKEEWVAKGGSIVERRRLPGDPEGYVKFDLKEDSEFYGHSGSGNYYGADYDSGELNFHHSNGRHEYLVSGTAIKADVVINLPKLKTHKKAGVTVSLKNLVGINGDKNWLPHHTEPSGGNPGDERPQVNESSRLERTTARGLRALAIHIPLAGLVLQRAARRVGRHVFGDTEEVIRSGNWWGNDTIWRTCIDLNKILKYGNADGTMHPAGAGQGKKHLVFVDGIIAGQGRGPMNPDPLDAGLVLFGTNPASVDAACAILMGYDPERIPIIRQSFCCAHYSLADWSWRDVRLRSNQREWNGCLPNIAFDSTLHFEPHFGWKGHIEREEAREHTAIEPRTVVCASERRWE
jgi:uncharacterized protein (DUF362 family)